MDENCCENPDIKIINGNRTCINCGVVHHPYFVNDWIDYNPRNVVLRKSVYCRTAYVKNKLQHLELSADEIQAFMDIWTTVENQLQSITGKRFPNRGGVLEDVLGLEDVLEDTF